MSQFSCHEYPEFYGDEAYYPDHDELSVLDCDSDFERYAFEMEQAEMELDAAGTSDEPERDYGFEEWCDAQPGRDDWMEQDEPEYSLSTLNAFIDRTSARIARNLAALKAMLAVGLA